MTFIDIDDPNQVTPGLIAGYSILCAVSIVCTFWAIHLGLSRLHYQSFFSVRVLFPIATFILALENAALAASGRIYNDLLADGKTSYFDNSFIKGVFILQTFEVPILLIVVFEITYLVHKRRSVNFCGMYFDEGVRVNNTAFMSFMLRNSIRTLAAVLLVMGLIVNFNLLIVQDPLAGKAGWTSLAEEDWQNIHLLLSLIPTAVLTLVSFYLSIILWRYGTESSMIVHSSMCNPWFYTFFGTVAMFIGQLFGEDLYAVMSNAGILIFIITILLLMTEVDKDIIASNDEANFLVQVAQKGDQIRVLSPSTPAQPIFEDEEMVIKNDASTTVEQVSGATDTNGAAVLHHDSQIQNNVVADEESANEAAGSTVDDENKRRGSIEIIASGEEDQSQSNSNDAQASR